MAILASSFVAGCGTGNVSQTKAPPPPKDSTSITLLASSDANAKLVGYSLTLNSLTLIDENGKSVTVLSTPEDVEFIHVNGTVEPLLTTTVPQGTYTSATASIGYSQFTCVQLNSPDQEMENATYAVPAPTSITVNLPAPINVTGAAMGLSLDLQVSKSQTLSSCYDASTMQAYSITPTFTLAPVSIASQPDSTANGLANNLQGLVSSIDSGNTGISVTPASSLLHSDNSNWHATLNSNTIYQGIKDASQIAVGMPVDMDVATQPDGSLLATRVAVYDISTTNLTLMIGPLLNDHRNLPGTSQFAAMSLEFVGHLEGGLDYTFDNADFQISGQLANLQSLPFTPSFTAANMVPGQRVAITSHDQSPPMGNSGTAAATVTLIPQTINGTVSATSSEGGFTTYTVTLAPYDIFPAFALQPNQPARITQPNAVVVYADADTQQLNTRTVVVGTVMRFYGLVFNDNGTLRMDCSQIKINDGVPE